MALSPRGRAARSVRTRNPSTNTETEEGGAEPLSHAQPCTTPRATPSTCPSKNGSDRDPDSEPSELSEPSRASFSFSMSSRARASPRRERPPSVRPVSSPPITPMVALASSINRGRPARDAPDPKPAPPASASLRSSTSASRIREDWTIRAATYTEHSSENATTMAVCVRARTPPRPPGLLFVFILPPKGLAQPLRSARPPHGLFTGSRGFAGAAVAAVYPTALAPAATAALPATPPPACDARGGRVRYQRPPRVTGRGASGGALFATFARDGRDVPWRWRRLWTRRRFLRRRVRERQCQSAPGQTCTSTLSDRVAGECPRLGPSKTAFSSACLGLFFRSGPRVVTLEKRSTRC